MRVGEMLRDEARSEMKTEDGTFLSVSICCVLFVYICVESTICKSQDN